MRESKFRAWDTHRNKMYSWSEIGEFDEKLSLSIWNLLNGFADHIIPLEYTGFKDKNGKEIYEGDIVRWSDVFEPYQFTAEVKWWEDRWVASNSKIGMPNASFMMIPVSREIIGNIYGNPDLLGGKS